MGRYATVYTSQVADSVLEGIAEGKSLRKICGELEIHAPTVRNWVVQNFDKFAERYEAARQLQWDAWADEILEVADESDRDTTTNSQGEEIANTEWISRSRLRVDARKWLLSKLHHKKFGDKLDLNNTHQACDTLLAVLNKIATNGNGK